MTLYAILKQHEENRDDWAFVAEREARSARSAISGYLGDSAADGSFVAIPRRSFRPVTVKVETKTALKFS